MRAYQDPDDVLVVLFKLHATENEAKSREAGRPIFDEIEVCEIRAPGSKDVKVFPATSFARWVDDPVTFRQIKQSYAERFAHQYRQFKAQAQQTKSGTPLDHAPFLSEGRRAELRAQNVYTVEQLAAIEDPELKNLGPGGRDMKNSAMAYIEEGKAAAPNVQLMAELEALKARNAVLEGDFKVKQDEEGEFAVMEPDEIREYIKANTGQEPIGLKNMNRKTLVRLAMNARPEKVA